MDPIILLRALGFAAEKHRLQRRKDAEQSPYVNHLIDVATILAVDGGVTDEATLLAAVLHDTVEDTQTSLEELATRFGAEVAGLVAEVTDDKSLPKPQRKELQVEHARHASPKAKRIKIADKISNVRDVCSNPPADWTAERRQAYLEWAVRVVEGCRGIEPALDEAFDRVLAEGRRNLET